MSKWNAPLPRIKWDVAGLNIVRNIVDNISTQVKLFTIFLCRNVTELIFSSVGLNWSLRWGYLQTGLLWQQVGASSHSAELDGGHTAADVQILPVWTRRLHLSDAVGAPYSLSRVLKPKTARWLCGADVLITEDTPGPWTWWVVTCPQAM